MAFVQITGTYGSAKTGHVTFTDPAGDVYTATLAADTSISIQLPVVGAYAVVETLSAGGSGYSLTPLATWQSYDVVTSTATLLPPTNTAAIATNAAAITAETAARIAGDATKAALPAHTGLATLSSGTVTVSDAAITANSIIRLSSKTTGGTPGALYVSARSASTSFAITSTSNTDSSVVQYEILAY